MAKQGLNKGRFSLCSRPQDKRCEHFAWHDKEPGTPEESDNESEIPPKISPSMNATINAWLQDPEFRARIESLRPDLPAAGPSLPPTDTEVKEFFGKTWGLVPPFTGHTCRSGVARDGSKTHTIWTCNFCQQVVLKVRRVPPLAGVAVYNQKTMPCPASDTPPVERSTSGARKQAPTPPYPWLSPTPAEMYITKENLPPPMPGVTPGWEAIAASATTKKTSRRSPLILPSSSASTAAFSQTCAPAASTTRTESDMETDSQTPETDLQTMARLFFETLAQKGQTQ